MCYHIDLEKVILFTVNAFETMNILHYITPTSAYGVLIKEEFIT